MYSGISINRLTHQSAVVHCRRILLGVTRLRSITAFKPKRIGDYDSHCRISATVIEHHGRVRCVLRQGRYLRKIGVLPNVSRVSNVPRQAQPDCAAPFLRRQGGTASSSATGPGATALLRGGLGRRKGGAAVLSGGGLGRRGTAALAVGFLDLDGPDVMERRVGVGLL